MNTFAVRDKKIGPDQKPFIIAEMSGNHNGDIERAFQLIDAAAEAGADALKIQTYTADTMTIKSQEAGFVIDGGLWDGRDLHSLYEEAYTPWEWHQPIFDRCADRGMIGFSSAFDLSSVDFLETLDVPIYKISSLELTDTELVAKVAQTGKPLILSTGMGTLSEIDDAVQVARENGCKDIVLLKCTSAYPAKPEDANLRTIPNMAQSFQCQAGLSDHTLGSHIPVAAVALGATVIEKHFTLRRADGGVDSAFSLEPEELKNLVDHTRDAKNALGHVQYGTGKSEVISKTNRRSLYVVEDIKEGEILTEKNLRSIRPGQGLAIKHFKHLLGVPVARDVKKGTPMSWDIISKEGQSNGG